MFVEEVPRSFVKKNNSYSHCPLKKRPVLVINEDVPKVIKEEIIDVVTDDVSEPENLSTKPEDLSRHAERRLSQPQQQHQQQQQSLQQQERQREEIEKQQQFIFYHQQLREQQHLITPEQLSLQFPPKPPSPSTIQTSPISLRTTSPSVHPHHHILHPVNFHHHNHFPTKAITPPAGIAPIHPVAKKARIEVIQHESSSSRVVTGTTSSTDTASDTDADTGTGTATATGTGTGTGTAAVSASSAPLHFIVSKASLEPLNLNTPVEPSTHYATSTWANSAPIYPPHYLPYPATYRYHSGAPSDLYQSFPLPSYTQTFPEDPTSVSPPPHIALTCPTIQRPIARSYNHWANPDQCGLSPTSSLESGSLRSPPPVTPEDLSSPGSESGRSSTDSTSAGPTVDNAKIKKNSSSSSSTANSPPVPSQRHQCKHCGKSYSTFSGISKHYHFHCAATDAQKKSFSCKSCNKVYVSLGALKMHIRTHTLPCKCTTCGKAFSRPWLLQGHIRTHTGEKPFSCQHCNRAFADRSNLRAHLQTHSEVKKYSCSSCRKTFSRMSLLSKHQEGGCPGTSVAIGYDHL
ncbi:protein escargot-like [Polistes fuscatus]|uniref:protein escargot-like n=1 Tax=Polistes fuscatus TaxID=30207 RepID=UPI001CA9A2FB|nr:protein escargot-like [Polistes fuscatus]